MTMAEKILDSDLLVGDFEDKEYDESELELIDFEFVELRLVRHTL